MCKHKLLTLSVVPSLSRFNWFWRSEQQVDPSLLKQLVAGSVMEGASMMFHGDYKKRCLLTILVSQILPLTKLLSEIKDLLPPNGVFTTPFLITLLISFTLLIKPPFVYKLSFLCLNKSTFNWTFVSYSVWEKPQNFHKKSIVVRNKLNSLLKIICKTHGHYNY